MYPTRAQPVNPTADLSQLLQPTLHPTQSTVTGRAVFRLCCMTVGWLGRPAANDLSMHHSKTAAQLHYRKTIGLKQSAGAIVVRPIVQLLADTIVRWDYRPNPNHMNYHKKTDVAISINSRLHNIHFSANGHIHTHTQKTTMFQVFR